MSVAIPEGIAADALRRIEREERRLARASYRRGGGTARRPLRSFLTEREKAERREEHAERIREALEHVATPEGMLAWLESRELHEGHEWSPLTHALIALQAPGQIVDTFEGWKAAGCPVAKGARAGVWSTRGPNREGRRYFWPKALFSASQVAAPPELRHPDPVALPDEDAVARLCERLRAIYADAGRDTAALYAFADELPGLLEGARYVERASEAEHRSDDIPF
jgi:hypothetical protein